jgi:hypothetical protein
MPRKGQRVHLGCTKNIRVVIFGERCQTTPTDAPGLRVASQIELLTIVLETLYFILLGSRKAMRLNVARKWTRNLPFRSYSTRHDPRQVISEKNTSINAFVSVSQRPTSPQEGLPLSGTTIAIKDNIVTASLPTTCSSSMLRGLFNIIFDLPTLTSTC